MADRCWPIKVAVLTIWSILHVIAQDPAILSVTNVTQGATATFQCSLPNLASSTSLDIYKDNVALYMCTDIAFTCSKTISDKDYSDVTFTALGTASDKGTFTVANADQTRDGGEWACQYGTSLISSSVTFAVSAIVFTSNMPMTEVTTDHMTTRAQGPAILSVTDVIPGATATFECSLPYLESITSLEIYKDNVTLYTCIVIAIPCNKSSSDKDYSDVTFTDLGTASAKGTFTVTNADQNRDGGEWTCQYGSSLISSSVTFVVSAQYPAILSVTNVIPGATATFECSLPYLESITSLDMYKDNVPLYTCIVIAIPCNKSSSDKDYSDVTFTDLGTASAKGTFTVANANQTRDGGEWACQYGSSLISSSVTFVVSAPVILSVTNVIPGATATFECSLPYLEYYTSLSIYKDYVPLYQCVYIAFPCSQFSSDNDYSDVTFTDLGTASAKGTFTVANADQTRDGGEWICQYGSSLTSYSVTFVVSDPALLSVTNVIQGATATFECTLPNLDSFKSLEIYKDYIPLYTCIVIASPCSKSSSDNDYSDVTFTDLGTASAKGTFTVANADQTRDGGEWACQYGSSLISSSVTFVVSAQYPAILSVTNVIPGATATFECSFPNLDSFTPFDMYKDNVPLYQCTHIFFPCSKLNSDNDYSDVTFTDLGTYSAKGTFTVANADQTRDGGEWTCQYGSSLTSSSVTFVVSDPAIISVTNVIPGATATFECSLPNLESSTSLVIYKDYVPLYTCLDIAFPCSQFSSDNDYSDVTFTDLGTASAKGTFTVANADQTRDGGEWICQYGSSLTSYSVTFVVSDPAILSVTNVIQGATATFECSLPNLDSFKSLEIYKDYIPVYACIVIASPCSKSSSDNDYSDVTFTDLGTASAKGTFTVSNADQTRDGGEWACQYGSSLISSSVTFVVSANVAKPESNVGPVIGGAIGCVVVGAMGMLATIYLWRRYQERITKSQATTNSIEERGKDSNYQDLTQNRSAPSLDYQTLNPTEQATPVYLELESYVTEERGNDSNYQDLTQNRSVPTLDYQTLNLAEQDIPEYLDLESNLEPTNRNDPNYQNLTHN